MRSTSISAMIFIAAFAVPSFAQTPPSGPPTPIRGTVEKFDDHAVTVKSRDGHLVTVTLAPKFIVRSVVAKTLSDIKPGDKVGITSVEGSDGARKAIEVHILPASAPNVRLGETPWNLRPGSLMTNAIVAEVSGKPAGRTIKVTFNGKEAEITVPTDTPIVGYAPGDANLLKPGTTVVAFARKQPDGSLAAAGVTAEKDGVKPPM